MNKADERQGNMGEPAELHFVTIYNKPPFINEILKEYAPAKLSQRVIEGLIKEAEPYDLGSIMTALSRRMDTSGFVPDLAGIYSNPQDVLEYLTEQGHEQLMFIAKQDPDLQDEIFETLNGSGFSLRALLLLDKIQQNVVYQLQEMRHSSSLAQALRHVNEQALRELYSHPERLISAVFDRVVSLEERSRLKRGEPLICYQVQSREEAVNEVWQYYFLPDAYQISLPLPYRSLTVGSVLEEITPEIYKRVDGNEMIFDPRTPSGFMGLLGKVGGAMPRLIARQIKADEHLLKRVMREEEVSGVLYELFTGYPRARKDS
jgi:hypothetical protein